MITMRKNKIINISSGKGGTGKTVIAATLGYMLADEGKKVLLVDCDMFVRGLTILLYKHKEKPIITEKATLMDILTDRLKEFDIQKLGIENYKGFFILPAVSSIDEMMDFERLDKFSLLKLKEKFRRLFKVLKLADFDYILLDTQAGTNPLSMSSAVLSDIIISVAEEDPIALATMSNFERHMRKYLRKKREPEIYTLINKARDISERSELFEKDHLYKNKFLYNIGVIPFDIEVMNSFGKEDFWHKIKQTLFISGLVNSWNSLSKFEMLDPLRRIVRTLPDFLFLKRLGKYSIVQRVLLLYGISLALLSVGLIIIPIFDKLTTFQKVALFSGILSLIFILFGLFYKRKYTSYK